MRKSYLLAAATTAVAAMTFSTQASAGDPLAGAIIGGGIGAAIGGPPGAAVGAIIGTIAGASDPYYHHGYPVGGYYGAPPAYYAPAPAPEYYPPAQGPAYYPAPQAPAYYPSAPAYYAPSTVYYAPPVVYGAPRAYAYGAPRAYAYGPRYVSQGRYYDRRGGGQHYRNGHDRGYR